MLLYSPILKYVLGSYLTSRMYVLKNIEKLCFSSTINVGNH